METRVEDTIEKYHMIPKDATVIVGLSGGADSVALAHFLYLRQQAMQFTLIAVHLNHGLRGAEAERDEIFVSGLCRSWNVPLHIRHVDVKKEAQLAGEGEEECGRRLRYLFFNELADSQYPGARIATAHTFSDNMETILFHIVRGTGLRGLCGIPPVRGNVIRPCIDCIRDEIEAYCKKENLSYVTDSTNFEHEYARNRLRLDIMPLLYQMNPSLAHSMRRMLSSVREDENYLQSLAQEAYASAYCQYGYRVAALKELPEPVLNRIIQMAVLEKTGHAADFESVNRVKELLKGRNNTQIAGGCYVRLRKGMLEFISGHKENTFFEQVVSENFNELPSGSLKITLYQQDAKNNFKKINKNLLTNCIDCDKIRGKMITRSRKDGDSYRIFARNCTKTLKKLFNEAGIAPEQRDSVPVVCDDEGILWVYGFGAAERCAVREDTQRLYLLDFQEKQDVQGIFDRFLE